MSSKSKINFVILTLVLICFQITTKAEVNTWQPPAEVKKGNQYITPSAHYKIQLLQNGKVFDTFVYESKALHYTNNSKTTAWTSFSFSEPVTVRIIKLQGDVDFFQVLPRNRKIEAVRKGNVTEFVISKPGQYSAEFQKGIKIDFPLLIFADPIETNVPSKTDPDVIYFGPGYHSIGDRYKIPSGKTVYIAGGAYVKGQFYSDNVENLKIIGRGILSGEDYKARTGDHMITLNNSNNLFVEGITIIHMPRFAITTSGINHHIKNVKMMGWWFSTDGVSTGVNALIEDCFFKVNDDAIKMYQHNTIARNCVIWQMENGMPFQLGWGRNTDVTNGYAYNCDVIRVEHEWDNENEAVIGAIHGGSGNIRHYLFEDIRIDNSDWRIFHFVTRPNRWGKWDPDKGSLSDIRLRNIEFYGKQRIPSLIMGHDEKHPVFNIVFENLVINGEKVTVPDASTIIIDPESTHGIQFK